jgi:hypothetical protein
VDAAETIDVVLTSCDWSTSAPRGLWMGKVSTKCALAELMLADQSPFFIHL